MGDFSSATRLLFARLPLFAYTWRRKHKHHERQKGTAVFIAFHSGAAMRITTIPLGVLETNSYIIDNDQKALVIDVGGDPAPILDFLQEEGLELEAILVTHRHFDHQYGIAALQGKTGVPCYVPAGDDVIASTEISQGGLWGMPLVPPFKATPFSSSLPLPSFSPEILLTPGHSPGAVAYYFKSESCVFSGDTLFYHSMGRTDFAMGDQTALLDSISRVLFALPDSTKVYPGHGLATSIGEERNHNPYIGDFAGGQ